MEPPSLILPRPKLAPHGGTIAIDIDNKNPHENPHQLVERTRNAFNSNITKDVKFRKKQLKNLLKFLKENRDALCEALYKDLRKPRHEAIITEVANVEKDVRFVLGNLGNWTKPERPSKGILNFFDGLYVYNEPFGVVLVMGAWNYPLHLTLSPLVGAIAAGNCVVIKPSNIAPATSQILAKLLPQYLDSNCYPVFQGDVAEITDLLKERFDYIFFTGSYQTGRIIHLAANKFLTPTTLEMGGKSPVYIDGSVNMEVAVKRILWGKMTNSGQTCIAPDYILCTKIVQEKFMASAEKVLKELFGSTPKSSPDFARVVSKSHFERLQKLLANQKIGFGGNADATDLYIAPTILVDVRGEDAIMNEEIFGPILPIVNIVDEFEAVDFINKREKPLALYVFSKKAKVKDLFLKNTSSGAVTINDTLMHAYVDTLPFGGVGGSGIGSYHGKKSFDTFTHQKSVLKKNYFWLNEKLQGMRYPPYSTTRTRIVEELIKLDRFRLNLTCVKYVAVFCLGVAATVGVAYVRKLYREGEI